MGHHRRQQAPTQPVEIKDQQNKEAAKEEVGSEKEGNGEVIPCQASTDKHNQQGGGFNVHGIAQWNASSALRPPSRSSLPLMANCTRQEL